MYLQEACVGPDWQVKFRSIGDKENVAVDVDGRSYWSKQKGENVAGLMGRDKNWCAEIMHLLKTKNKKTHQYFTFILIFLLEKFSADKIVKARKIAHIEHCLGFFGKGHIVDAYGKVESISEVDGPVHWIYRTVSDVEQGGCVVKAQVPRNSKH